MNLVGGFQLKPARFKPSAELQLVHPAVPKPPKVFGSGRLLITPVTAGSAPIPFGSLPAPKILKLSTQFLKLLAELQVGTPGSRLPLPSTNA